MEALLLAGIAAVFVAGIAAPAATRLWGDRAGVFLGGVPLAAFVAFACLVPAVGDGAKVAPHFVWAPSLGISLSFYVDGLSVLFLLIISAVGTAVTWYAAGYLKGHPDLGKFYLSLFGFMGAMLGLVSADNLILLFVFWELTSITSYLLIGFYCDEARSRRAALQALLVTGGGGLAMLAGIILLGFASGTTEISGLLEMPRGELAAHPLFPVFFVLILLGAFTKSAQFPFHFWLPNAMEAPAPVSAFLHSATMVKAGVFLLARLFPVFSPSPLWGYFVAPVGAVTMIVGVALALGQTDLKRMLAYSTISVLGTLTMLLGLGTELAVKAAMAYLLAHALYKAALFMTAGSIDHETGTREAEALSGLRRAMPLTATAALLGSLSMLGFPFLLGFVGKEYFYKALLGAGGPGFLWEALGVAASAGMFALAIAAGIRPFWGSPRETPKPPHEAPWTMWIGPLTLGMLALKLGMFPGWAGGHVVVPAAAGVLGNAEFVSMLKLWHGLTPALALSGLTFLLGFVAWKALPRFRVWGASAAWLARFGPERAYDRTMEGLLACARWQTAIIQNGYLRNYLLTVGAFSLLLVALVFPFGSFRIDPTTMVPPTTLGVTVCALITGAALFACLAKSRFTAILALGFVGLGIAILYFLYSGPDLAMTQILVETLTLVLFVLAFRNLPLLKEFSKPRTRIRDGILSLGFGAMMGSLVLVAFHFAPPMPPISGFMGEASYPEANGRNVVNVILVDFRALDTLGEITVLAIAALGVLAMLKLKPKDRKKP
jgi:multicomponent Na+:H+ antiporter subunit A